MPELYLQVLPRLQRSLWDQFQKKAAFLAGQGYYLAGGSALALQIGHRRSIDFDFFSRKKALSEPTHNWLQEFSDSVVRDRDTHTLHAEVKGVKVSFISAYKYPTVEPLIDAEGIRLAGILDIALMKLLALTHRATLRDYIDLAVILRDCFDLKKLLTASRKKYGKNFNVLIPLRALVTFTDIDPETPVLLDKSLATSWKKILREAVKKTSA